ncbi:MAG: cytosine deaminase [Deltaproteobacteria bacterium]|nr:MAG: cytosine deaminase [Deltaproteobacteria bacterium]
MSTLVQRAALLDEVVDLRIEGATLVALAPAGSLRPRPHEEVLVGGRITPPLAEPHVHLDATLLGERAPNVSGTLREGIANWARLRRNLTHDDVVDRATRTAEAYASYGALRLRTHVDTGSRVAVEALLSLVPILAERGIELEVVAFPQEGIFRAPGRREDWVWAIEAGCHAVGAIPHFERTTEEGWRSVRLAFDLAEAHDRRIDMHCDETDDPGSRHLEVVCAEALDRGFAGRVVAGHCTSLHSQPNAYAAKVIELVATAGVQVVTNPLDNAVLQGRYDSYPRRRGLTRVDELWAAGAQVGIGHDSVQDPWYPLGTANLLDAAYVLIHLGHLTSHAAMRRVFRTLHGANHLPFGGAPVLTEGGPARLLWWPLADELAILRERPRPRVWRGLREPVERYG